MRLSVVFVALFLVGVSAHSYCEVNTNDRKDCGFNGIDQGSCEAKGCCWGPVGAEQLGVPWCFLQKWPAPVPPGPPTTPAPPPPTEIDLNILSYNLEWWKNRQYPSRIAATINSIGSFDLMGFQESPAPAEFLDLVSKFSRRNYSFKQGGKGIPPHSEGWGKSGDITIAWNTKVLKKVSEGDAVAGKDAWNNRYLHWVRLNVIGTSKHIVMSNTHGPVCMCKGSEDWKSVAHNYINNTKGAMQPGDHMFMTGDFNCGATPSASHDPQGHGLDDIIVEMRKEWKDLGAASFFKPALYQPDRLWVMKDSDVKVKSINAQCCQRPGSDPDHLAPIQTTQTTLTTAAPTLCKAVPMKKDDPDDPAAPTCTAAPSNHMLLEAKVTVPLGSSQVQIIV